LQVLDVRDVAIEVDAETGDPISDEIVRYVPPSAEGTESVGAQDSAELMQVTTHLSTPPLFNVPPLDESMLAALPSCEQWGGWPRLQLSKSAVHHTKTTLAVLAAKLPHEFGVLMRTRAAVAEAVQLIESVEDAASYHAQIAPPRVEAPLANGQRWFPYPPDTFEMALDTALVMALDTAPVVGPGLGEEGGEGEDGGEEGGEGEEVGEVGGEGGGEEGGEGGGEGEGGVFEPDLIDAHANEDVDETAGEMEVEGDAYSAGPSARLGAWRGARRGALVAASKSGAGGAQHGALRTAPARPTEMRQVC
jgi:hypothetical protein